MLLWLLLAAWWGVYPLLPRMQASLWFVHIGVVVLAGLLAVPRVWRTRRVVAGVPLACVLAVIVSTMIAARREPGVLPLAERWWAALGVSAHGLWFLAALALVPRARAATPRPPRHRRSGDPVDDTDGVAAGSAADIAAAGELSPGRVVAVTSTERAEAARQGAIDDEMPQDTRFRRGFAVLLGAVLGVQTLVALSHLDETTRMAGSLGNPNVFGACMAATALAFAACLRWHRAAPLTLLGVFGLLVATRSRGAVAAALLVVGGFVARRSLAAVLVLLVGVGVALVVVPNPLVERLLAMRQEGHYSRTFLWSTAASLIPDHRWGLGPAMYKYVFPPLALDPAAPWLVHQRHSIGLTHNAFLTLVVECGWLAGAAGVALVGWSGWRVMRKRSHDALCQAGLLGATVLLLEAQVDAIEQNPLVFSLLLFLAALSLQRVTRPCWGLAVPGPLAAATLLVATVTLGAAASARIGPQLTLVRAEHAMFDWRLDAGSTAHAEQALLEARARLPHEARPARLLFDLRFSLLRDELAAGASWESLAGSLAAVQEAIDAACAANPVDPRHERARTELALLVLRREGRSDGSFEAFRASAERVLILDPLDAKTRRELAQEAQRQGRLDVSSFHLSELFRLEPDDAYAWYVSAALADQAGHSEQALYAWIRAREAVFNCRVKASVDDPGAQAYFRDILDRTDLDVIRRRIVALRRKLY